MPMHVSLSSIGYIVLWLSVCLVVNCEAFIQKPSFERSTRTPQYWKCSTEPVASTATARHEEVLSTTTSNCQFCQESFQSRNALFRHLKSNPECSVKANMVDNQVTLIALAVQFSYHASSSLDAVEATEAATAGKILQEAIVAGVEEYISKFDVDAPATTILGSSQSSLARLRHIALDQEAGCGAAGDTMVVRIQGPHLSFTDEDHQRIFLERLIHSTNRILTDNDADTTTPLIVQLEACKLLSHQYGKLLHCEQMCTQRVYHYLLPLRWLPDGKELEKWWIETSVPDDGTGHTNKSSVRPPSEALKRMKQFLRSAEAERLDRYLVNDDIRWASGRFGSLGEKKRIPWHNFADPKLQGSASPNTKPVWRVVDRARFQLLLSRDRESLSEKEVVAVLEFRGDDFLPQQIRRIVGTTLAMTHGWLPEDTLEVATRADCFVETVLAPAGRLYLVENRFHWDEMRTDGLSVFESHVDGVAVQRQVATFQDSAMSSIQNRILTTCDNDVTQSQENTWLEELEQSTCPRIRHSLEEWHRPATVEGTNTDTLLSSLNPAPVEYRRTLDLLRDIIATDQWPETSVARSTVIGNIHRDPVSVVHKRGSFTVINPRYCGGRYKNGVGNDPLPLGNENFPMLVEAVFDLEEAIVASDTIKQARPGSLRQAAKRVSSHCAINCNAQFTPHVDSGRGAGQSLSMIVGLGDYLQGELGVEGVSHDIRYQPLEFDGWRLRHWTKAFHGERFSLVWFTPELKGGEMIAEQFTASDSDEE